MSDALAASSIVPAIHPPLFESRGQQHYFDEGIRVLVERGHHVLVQRIILFLEQRQLHDAMRLLNEQHCSGSDGADTAALHEFHARLDDSVHMILDLDDGHDERETFRVFRLLVLIATRETAGFRDYGVLERYAYGSDGGFGTVPAPAAAVAALERRTFHGGGNCGGDGDGGTECSICFEDFVDGGEVSVMPCPSRHQFHSGCIAKWLGISNMCPLCRHVLVSNAPAAASTMAAADETEPDRGIDEEESRARRDEPMTTAERRSSSRQRRPNVRISGPEWVRQ